MSKNSFKDIEPQVSLPKKHKKQVMDSLELATLAVDFWDLFTTKRFNTETEILNTITQKNKDDKKK